MHTGILEETRTMTDALPARDRSQGEPRSIGSLDGTCYLHVDQEGYNFYLEVKPEHSARYRCDLLTQAEWWGLELMPEDECPAEVTVEGNLRVYLTPKVVAEPIPLPIKTKTIMLPFNERTLAGAGIACALLPVYEFLTSLAPVVGA